MGGTKYLTTSNVKIQKQRYYSWTDRGKSRKDLEHRSQLNEKNLDTEKKVTELRNQLSKHDRTITDKSESVKQHFIMLAVRPSSFRAGI
ncbi:MAG: hypothetical protein GKC53_03185 [Neisseriaceae bacterium]|nr:MAG: hypothetical protein GKC53_03185 [Neisseriaceae bacterium]